MPTMTPIGQQPGQVVEPVDLSATVSRVLLGLRQSDTQYFYHSIVITIHSLLHLGYVVGVV
jgi:hypothetical protein